MKPLILSIDTSCDDTSAAVVCGRKIWSNIVASQTDLHRPYGGVFPTIAKQAHKENIAPTVTLALKRAKVTFDQIRAIAVTIGPGLAPALEVGIEYAQELASQYLLPLYPVNHIEGHLLSVLAQPRQRNAHQSKNPSHNKLELTSHPPTASNDQIDSASLPALGLVVSGGNTLFVLIKKRRIEKHKTDQSAPPSKQALLPQLTPKLSTFDRQPRLQLVPNQLDPTIPWFSSGQFSYTILGQTLDDAAGECLDKVGRMLNLGYPAAPVVEELAKFGDHTKYPFPLPMTTTHDYNTSFAGIKTFSRRFIESEWGQNPSTKQNTYDFCASLQYAVFRHICYKLNKIIIDFPQIQEVWLGGGVATNMTLRKMIRQTLRQSMPAQNNCNANSTKHVQSPRGLRIPYTKRLCMDNAGMGGIIISLH